MILKKIVCPAVCALLIFSGLAASASAQNRDKVVKQVLSRPINQPPASTQNPIDRVKTLSSSAPINAPPAARPTLTNNIEVVKPLVKKTGSSSPVNTMATAAASAAKMVYSPVMSGAMLSKIQSMIGIPYLYGATGPNRYDCSGFVWEVFRTIGIDFERTSARTLWNTYEPVSGDERYKFGTLVFFNHLGHVGIVADENGFYHASSSKGITYSKFTGYWEKRIVGFRKIPMNVMPTALPAPKSVE